MDLSVLNVGQPEKLVVGLTPRLRKCRTIEQACNLLSEEMYEQCRSGPDGERALVLSRIFLSVPFHELDPETASHVRKPGLRPGPSDHYFTLMGTYGTAPEWRDRRLSVHHRAIHFAAHSPPDDIMLQACFNQVGFDLGLLGSDNGVPDRVWTARGPYVITSALGSDLLPDQEGFIKPHGVRSVIGSAATLPDGAVSLWVGFSRQPVTEEGAWPLLSLLPGFWYIIHSLYRRRTIFSS